VTLRHLRFNDCLQNFARMIESGCGRDAEQAHRRNIRPESTASTLGACFAYPSIHRALRGTDETTSHST